MTDTIPARVELKARARRRMGQALGVCCTLGAAVAIAQLLADAFLQRAGGAFPLYYWDTASHAIPNSVSFSAQGLYAALRLEEMGFGLSVAASPAMLLTFALVRLFAAAATAPLRLGCLEHLWAAGRGEARPFRGVFAWYTDPRRAGRAALLELLLEAVQLVLLGLCGIPALVVLVRSGGGRQGFTAAAWLFMAAWAAVWCVMTQLLPARYLLGRKSGAGVGAALRECRALLRGRRGQYLLFHLSFWLWDLLNTLSRGILNLYVFPYKGLAHMGWIETAQRDG